MKADVIIVGARGLGIELASYIEDDPRYSIKCFLDEADVGELCGYEVIHPVNYIGNCKKAFFAVGYPEYKLITLDKYSNLGLEWLNYVHPTAIISKYASVGTGNIFSPYTVVAGNACISNFVMLNAYSSTAHHTVIGDYSSLMPYSSVLGGSKIGEEVLIAVGAKVLPDVTVGDRSRVSAGAVVMHDMPSDVLISGNPAKHQPDITMLRRRKIERAGLQ